jgi:transposase
MQKAQKAYTAEFKRAAVHLAQTSGKPITHIARELGILDASIQKFRKELAEHGPEAFPGSGHQTALEEENRRLKRELERVRQERDSLKKPEVTSRTESFEVAGRGKISRGLSRQSALRGARGLGERVLPMAETSDESTRSRRRAPHR